MIIHVYTVVQDYYNEGINVVNFDTLGQAQNYVKKAVWSRWGEFLDVPRPKKVTDVSMEFVELWHNNSCEGDHPNVYRIQEQILNMTEYFPITSVSRADVAGILKEPKLEKKLTNSQMDEIADKMATDYLNQMYWESLEIIAQYVLGQD